MNLYAAELARAICHALRHLSPTPALAASGLCPPLFEGKSCSKDSR
jgi:hypothetical protein